jgi:hypothetical protein
MASIQGVYVALFGRPADPTGLAYFNGVTKNGADLSAINNLAGEKEYTDRFAGQSNVQIVNSIYISLFNRPAEPTGLNFFVDALNKGTLNINNIAIAILDGAQGNDKTVAANKIASADLFTAALDTPSEIGSYTGANAAASARAWLSTVTTTAATQAQVDAQVKAIEVIGTGGVTLNIDAGAIVSPTATSAALKSGDGDDTINTNAGQNITAATTINAGFGTDTVKAAVAANYTTSATSLVSVENLYLAANTGAVTADLTLTSGLAQVWNNASTTALTYTGINAGATLGVSGTVGAAASFTYKDAATGTTNVVLTAANVASSVTVGNGAETVALSTSGGSSIASFIDTTVKNLNITGSGNLTLTFDGAAGSDVLAKVDASGLTGGKLTLNVANADGKVTITGSNQADTITLAAANGVADTIVYNKAEASTFTTFESIVGFNAVGEDKIDLKAFGLTKTSDITLFNNAIEGASFGANSVAKADAGNGEAWIFVDSNNDGKLNLATDFAIQLDTVGVATIDVADFIFA